MFARSSIAAAISIHSNFLSMLTLSDDIRGVCDWVEGVIGTSISGSYRSTKMIGLLTAI